MRRKSQLEAGAALAVTASSNLNNRTHNQRNGNKAMTSLLNSSRNGGLIRKPFLRKILALALMGAALALFLCAAGGLSYGDPARSKLSILTVETHYYPTFGTPNDALVTADNAYVLVSVSGATGVQVFRNSDFTNPCGGQQILNFPRPRPGVQPVQTVDGMQFFPGSPQVSVGAAVEAHGAEFFRLASLTAPCAIDGIVNVPQLPVISNCPNAPNLLTRYF